MYLLYHKSELFASEGKAYGLVFSILMLSFPAWCLMYVYSTLLTANGSMKALNLIAFGGVLSNLTLNYYMVTHYQAIGGAITSLLTQTALAFAFMFAAIRIIGLPNNARWVLAHLGYAAFACICGYAIYNYVPAPHPLQLGLFGSICIAAMFLFRFVSPANIRQLLRSS